MTRPRPWVLTLAALGLFGVWSNSFVAIGYLLGSDAAAARLDWVSLTVARFLCAGLVCAVYCLGFRRHESLELLRAHWPRLGLCGLLVVPGYNLALYYGQQHGIPAPIASLTTTLVPLFVMALAVTFLGERLTSRRIVGLAVSAAGMALIGLAENSGPTLAYPLLVGITGLAPLCWSVYSVISKPMTGRASPLLWTYLATSIGGAVMLPALPGTTWRQCLRLDAPGWAAVLYLALPCTVLGFAVWTWLLKHLPASTVGFTVFLNPPLTATSKFLLASLFPAIFLVGVRPLEWLGGAVTLAGLAVAVYVPRAARGGRVAARAG